MADSTGAEQDAGVTKERFDGLMSAYQKSLADNRAMAEKLAQAPQVPEQQPSWTGEPPPLPDPLTSEPEVVADPPAQDSRPAQPQYEPGDIFMANDAGELVAWTPRPIGNNPRREMTKGDDGSPGYLQGKLAEQGFRPRSTNWP
jgi:hypothetical protein